MHASIQIYTHIGIKPGDYLKLSNIKSISNFVGMEVVRPSSFVPRIKPVFPTTADFSITNITVGEYYKPLYAGGIRIIYKDVSCWLYENLIYFNDAVSKNCFIHIRYNTDLSVEELDNIYLKQQEVIYMYKVLE